jgi:hypothetical protein
MPIECLQSASSSFATEGKVQGVAGFDLSPRLPYDLTWRPRTKSSRCTRPLFRHLHEHALCEARLPSRRPATAFNALQATTSQQS